MPRINHHNLDKLEKLPFIQGFRRQNERNTYRRIWYHDFKDDFNPYLITERLLRKNIGKSFDYVFSLYCKRVPKHDQHIFLKEFRPDHRFPHRDLYFVDEQGLIQKKQNKRRSKPAVVKSPDYLSMLVHKRTGQPFSEFYEEFHYIWAKDSKGRLYRTKDLSKPSKGYYSYKTKGATSEDFELKIIKGWKKVFESKKDRIYKRLRHETQRSIKQSNKQAKKTRFYISDDEFKRLLREKELKERELDLIKIESHGFDPITSFRKVKSKDLIQLETT